MARPGAVGLVGADLPYGHHDRDDEEEPGERGEQDRLGDEPGQPGADRRSADGHGAEGDATPEQDVPRPLRGDRADQRGDPDHDQGTGGRLARGLAERVDEDRHREHGPAAAERTQ